MVTVSSIHAGTAPNIIPQQLTMNGTIRAANTDMRDQLAERVHRILEGIAAVHRVAAKLELHASLWRNHQSRGPRCSPAQRF